MTDAQILFFVSRLKRLPYAWYRGRRIVKRMVRAGQHSWERRRDEKGTALRVALRCNIASDVYFSNEDF